MNMNVIIILISDVCSLKSIFNLVLIKAVFTPSINTYLDVNIWVSGVHLHSALWFDLVF